MSGKYLVGMFLLIEIELEELFNVSKIMIWWVIEMLVMEEFVEKKSGWGIIVLSNCFYNKLLKVGIFIEFLNELG